ncbi:hypothetical protein [Lacinutrix sp. 5H-3-7-4]|uniref:DUF6892 domain-containing protein n=1 Tax=Lacinutrix sp. (strain 5H-3-7-4) TaxID=983544 RepID=UPI00020A3C34|nr:hypothetical protein [Lacinutrix sp. 5H-3-7-4]AEH01956.1 hypothetical protein Lacal_2110 [Lacinutrix sp. 5H-3-7-4]
MTTLHLSAKGFQINTEIISFPVSIEVLKNSLNANFRVSKTKHNTIYTWDDLGIMGYAKQGDIIESLVISYQRESYNFSPKNIFSGIFHFNNQDIITYYKSHDFKHVKLFKGDNNGALVMAEVSAWFDVDDSIIRAIEVGQYIPYDKRKGIPEDKYTIEPLDEEIIEFKDFGFKLSVIEELMYVKELLLPKFDLYEFANWYKARDIDIDEEGYNPITEVEQYFKNLPIPKKFASALTEIYQDGGNDIYMNLSPFSGGAVEFWDIQTSEDAKHFPNLKKATLCYATDTAYNEMRALGIDAQWL